MKKLYCFYDTRAKCYIIDPFLANNDREANLYLGSYLEEMKKKHVSTVDVVLHKVGSFDPDVMSPILTQHSEEVPTLFIGDEE